jgi:hypothetical protein
MLHMESRQALNSQGFSVCVALCLYLDLSALLICIQNIRQRFLNRGTILNFALNKVATLDQYDRIYTIKISPPVQRPCAVGDPVQTYGGPKVFGRVGARRETHATLYG